VRNALLVVCLAVTVSYAAPAFAQGDGGPDPATVKVHIGPLLMNPAINVSNIGVDNNVFNDPPDKQPKKDFTATVTPTTDFWMHLGPTWVSASLNEQINWFVKYASERTANNEYKLGWNVPGSVMSFKVDWDYVNARQRPGFEIDARVGQKIVTYNGSFDYKALSKTYIGLSGSRSRTNFADGAEFLGVNLQDALNRVTTTGAVNVRHQITPLTSITFSATRSMDEFEFSHERDSSTTGGNVSMSFTPGALIKGGFTIGYSQFKPVEGDLPGFKGVTGTVDLTYVLLGSTRFALTGSRGVQYSYDANQPYYVQTTFDASIAQQLIGPIDGFLHGGTTLMDYRDRNGVSIQVPDRQDHVNALGAGIGYHIGQNLRLAFNVDKVNRASQVTDRAYDNFKFGTALTVGF
jgi:hypothetical protein